MFGDCVACWSIAVGYLCFYVRWFCLTIELWLFILLTISLFWFVWLFGLLDCISPRSVFVYCLLCVGSLVVGFCVCVFGVLMFDLLYYMIMFGFRYVGVCFSYRVGFYWCGWLLAWLFGVAELGLFTIWVCCLTYAFL